MRKRLTYNIVMEKEREARKKDLEKLGASVRYGAPSFDAFGVGGEVKEVVYPRDGLALARAVKYLCGGAVVLGGATNVLFPDGVLERTVVYTSKLTDVSVRGDRVYCQAGARLPAVVSKCAGRGLSGIEQLAGIPGSVGGAIAMNAGAFGREIADVVTRVDAVTADGRVVALSPSMLGAGYRHTDIARMGLTVLGAELSLAGSTAKEVKERIEGYAARRRSSQPEGRSLGSVFKRADGVSAGYYIERAGLKGARAGGAEISEKHANFIINSGGATAAQFRELAELARAEVFRQFGITLEYEVIFL